MKHSTPTVRNVIFGFTEDVSAKVISIGSVAIAAKREPAPDRLVNPELAQRALESEAMRNGDGDQST